MTAAAALQANRGGFPLCHGPGQSIVAAVHPSITHIEPCISRHDRTVAACLRRNGNHRSSKRVDRSSAMMRASPLVVESPAPEETPGGKEAMRVRRPSCMA
ncbi:hypothetical protein V8C44DRAFT_904 [Trichoderma aethiopicum]